MLAQLCPALCDSMDCSPSGSPVYGISQARILVWIVISFPRGSSQPRDWTCIYFISGRFFTTVPPGKCLAVNRTSNSVLYSTPGLNWAWTKWPIFGLCLWRQFVRKEKLWVVESGRHEAGTHFHPWLCVIRQWLSLSAHWFSSADNNDCDFFTCRASESSGGLVKMQIAWPISQFLVK